jgi:hypothetical protein
VEGATILTVHGDSFDQLLTRLVTIRAAPPSMSTQENLLGAIVTFFTNKS